MAVNSIDLSNLSPLHGFIVLGRAANDYAGLSVSSAGDVNGDGIDDLIVGAHYGDGGGENAGEAYVVYGKTGTSRGPVDLTGLTANDGFIILGDAAYDIAGSSVSSAGDVNGDGIDDLIVGARYGDDGGTRAGEAYVIFGQVGEARGQIDLTELAAVDGFVIQGDEANDFAGTSVSSAGDINGDGIDDLIVGAFGGDDGGTHSGVAHVIYGKLGAARGTVDLTGLVASFGFNIQGDEPNDFAGRSVSSAGDVNGDGIDDLIVAASYGDNGGVDAGEVYVVYGQPGDTRGTVDLTGLAASGGFCIQGFVAGSFTGWSVSSAGDVNGDGIDDLIIGAPYSDIGGANAGEAYVIFGQAGATRGLIDLSGLASSDGFVIRGSAANNFVGYSVSSAGDVNGDGIDDLIVGAFGCNDGGSYAGKAYVIYGQAGDSRSTLDLTGLTASEGFAIQGAAVNDIAGTSVSSAGDVNGDGIDDLIIGAPYSDIGGTNSGAAYVIFGSRPSTAVDRTGTNIGQTIFGGNLDDTISGMGGNDCIDGGDGSDRLDGGSGIDSLDYSRSASAVEASLLNGTGTQGEAAGDTLAGFERIFGSAYADTLTGDMHANLLRGGAEGDTMDGGAGIDTLDYRTSTAAVNANLATGSGLGGDADGDVFSNFERILGSSDSDTLTGDAGRNVLFGRGGADVLDGGEGRDRLAGGSGNDTMSGGLGRDTFFFGAGSDKLDGGADWDVALLSGDQVEFYVANSSRNSWTVTQISTGDTDILTNIEALQFSDGSLANF